MTSVHIPQFFVLHIKEFIGSVAPILTVSGQTALKFRNIPHIDPVAKVTGIYVFAVS